MRCDVKVGVGRRGEGRGGKDGKAVDCRFAVYSISGIEGDKRMSYILDQLSY